MNMSRNVLIAGVVNGKPKLALAVYGTPYYFKMIKTAQFCVKFEVQDGRIATKIFRDHIGKEKRLKEVEKIISAVMPE